MFSPEIIKGFLEKNFRGKFKIVSSGREATINSIFEPDTNHHLSINLYTGLWQDFKSGESGTFPYLVSKVEGIPIKKAVADLTFQAFLLGQTVEDPITLPEYEVFQYSTEEFKKEFDAIEVWEAKDLPPLTFEQAIMMQNAKVYLKSRNLFNRGFTFYVSFRKDFYGRLLIPYQQDDKIFFFQGRTLINSKPKYKNYLGVKSSEILFPFDWEQDQVIVTEGPIDAITLQLEGVNATCVNGSKVSSNQARMLIGYGGYVVLAFDSDDAGITGAQQAYDKLTKLGLESKKIRFLTFPDSKYKDFNDLSVNQPNIFSATILGIQRMSRQNVFDPYLSFLWGTKALYNL